MWNFQWQDKKRLPFNTGDCLVEVTAWAGLTVLWYITVIDILLFLVMLCLIYLLTFWCIFGDNNQHLKYNISFEDIWNRTKDICLSQWFIMLQVCIWLHCIWTNEEKSKPSCSSCWMEAGFENDLFRTNFVCYLIIE